MHTSGGTAIPVDIRNGRLWPRRTVSTGERLTVDVTVKRPAWAGWLVGHTAHKTFHVVTPTRSSAGPLARGARRQACHGLVRPAGAARRAPRRERASHASVRRRRARRVRSGSSRAVPHRAGTVSVSSAPRTWERLSVPLRVSWFPARERVQMVAEPATDKPLTPERCDHADVLPGRVGGDREHPPTITPARARPPGRRSTPTRSRSGPTGLGFPLGVHVEVRLPRAGRPRPGRRWPDHPTLTWEVQHGTILRLHQLLAQTGYLPVDWSSSGRPVGPHALGAARGRRRSARRPLQLAVRGHDAEGAEGDLAHLRVERDHARCRDDVRARPRPRRRRVRRAEGLAGAARGRARRQAPHGAATATSTCTATCPQLLTLWHDGKTILTSPGNTGVPAAPTELGTFPVFEHIPIGTMAGHEPGRVALQRSGHPLDQLLQPRRGAPRVQPLELRHAAEPRLRRAPARRGGEGLALHADRDARHRRELAAWVSRRRARC